MPAVREANLPNIRMRYLTLNPVNSNGTSYSFKGGLPLVRFDIAATEVPTLLDGKNLRINGRFTARTGAGAGLTDTQQNYVDGYAGLFANCISNITVASKRLNSTLERVSEYSRLAPSIVSQVNNAKYIDTNLCHGGIHAGTIPQMRHALNTYQRFNTNGNAVGVNRGDAGQTGVDFSAPLYCGIFQSGQDIDISSTTGVGGITIECLIKSDLGVIFGSDAATNNATYTLDNLTLTVPIYEIEGQAAESYAGNTNMYQFNSWSNMFQTLNSSTSVVAFNPGLKAVTSCIQNFITSSDLGNQNFNNARLGMVGQLNQCRFSKNGALFPYQFRFQDVSKRNDDGARPDPATDVSTHTYKVNAEWVRYALEAVSSRKVSRVKNTALQYNGWGAGVVNRDQNAGREGNTPGTAFTQGVLYDAYGGGSDFSNTVFSFELNASSTNQQSTGLVAGAAVNLSSNSIDGTSATAQAVYLYFLNQNTIMYSPQGISIDR